MKVKDQVKTKIILIKDQ